MKRIILLAFVCLAITLGCKKEKKSLAAITTTVASAVTSTGVQTGGEVADDGGSPITKKGICWATHTGPSVSDSITDNGSGTAAFSVTLNNLSANTDYFVRAYAINASGTAYGNEVTFKTAAGLATVNTAAVSAIQPLSAESGGEVTNDGGAAITERGVVYATSANPTLDNFKIVAGSGTGSFTATLTPLASEQTYYVRAFATNSHGTAYGNQVQFNAASANTVTDIDGNVYTYVTLCDKDWTTSNLKTTKYNNGDAITNGLTGFNWDLATTGAYSFPNGEETRKDTFGLLYNLHVINDTRGVCPTGWHVPTDEDWKALEICQGMSPADADLTDFRGNIGTKLMEGGSSGLNLQKGGLLFPGDGGYYYFAEQGYYYSSTPEASAGNYYRGFNGESGNPDAIYRTYSNYGMSVRCVKD
jgi:uncharacterized protein (TIGR02145 family)